MGRELGVEVTDTNIAAEPMVAKRKRPFDQNIEGAIVRLQVADGQVLFGDAVVLTEHDLVVAIPGAAEISVRGESVRCSVFLLDDDSYVVHRDGLIHWEMTSHGERLCAVFLFDPAPDELLELTVRDQRREVRFPASLTCKVQSNDESPITGRLVNYSLNGVAAQLAEPLEIGSEYTVLVDANDDALELTGTCRWNVETLHGFVNGFSLEHQKGIGFARPVFQGTVMPMDIQRTTPTVSIRPVPQRRDDPVAAASREDLQPLITRTTILMLSLLLIWLAARIQNQLTGMTFLTGCIGLVTYIGLDWTSKMHQSRRLKQQAQKKQNQAESRLHAHVARQREVSQPEHEVLAIAAAK